MIRGVIFDFDGVLVPIDAELKRKLREEIADEYSSRFLLTREQALDYLNQALSESAYDDPYLRLQDAALRLGSFRRDEINKLFHQMSRERKIELENTIVDMLRRLKDCGLILGIVTLSSKERTESILRNTGVRRYFDFVESASKEFLEAPRSEWKKAAYQSFLDEYKFQASEVLCVGDTPSIDLQPARSFGMRTILVIHDDNRQLEQRSLEDNVLHRDALFETLQPLALDEEGS